MSVPILDIATEELAKANGSSGSSQQVQVRSGLGYEEQQDLAWQPVTQ